MPDEHLDEDAAIFNVSCSVPSQSWVRSETTLSTLWVLRLPLPRRPPCRCNWMRLRRLRSIWLEA